MIADTVFSRSLPSLLFAMVAMLLLAGCGQQQTQSQYSQERPKLAEPTTFSGYLSCPGCEQTRLDLTLYPEGYFRLRQHKGGESDYHTGRWAWAGSDQSQLQLLARADQRWFFQAINAGQLQLVDPDAEPQAFPQVLTRQPDLDVIVGPMPLQGLYRQNGDALVFTECNSGRPFPVLPQGQQQRLAEAYSQHLAAGQPALVALHGRFESRSVTPGKPVQEYLVVERFDRLLAGADCRASLAWMLVDTYWQPLEIGGQPVRQPAGKRPAHLLLSPQDNRVYGFSGCNQMAGHYQLDAGRLKFRTLATTRMVCMSSDAGSLEPAFLRALEATVGYRIEGDRLQLKDSSGKVLMVLEARPPAEHFTGAPRS
ncbi:META domain-containing protein [Marinobacterium arenosum]|uniref:META domain-containing protein n=1 Tax=Marinobacterium arenosum TaxID=2862496 RepID=UPI001C972E40|nr:META domain-containing protein [Marinobacterium arenosum]MBY4676968.1 META domain-containing protein [Marinobacterium arenosum]